MNNIKLVIYELQNYEVLKLGVNEYRVYLSITFYP
jgi:hypothetical protein